MVACRACGCRRPGSASCAISQPVAPPSLAATSMPAMAVVKYAYRTTPAAIATVRSARRSSAPSGWKTAAKICCRSPISTSSSPCRQSWRRWRCTTNAKSTAPCSLPPQLLSGPSPPTRSISALISASSPCCTPGARPWCTIPISTASSRAVAWHPTLPPGFPAATISSSRSGFSQASFAARCSPRSSNASLPIVSTSTALLPSWQIPLASEHSAINCAPSSGWCMPSHLSAGPEQVLKYLARYTHRVAIANSRITAANSDSVSFRYQDYAGGHRHRVMKLDSVEFLRRFLQHVLPNRFVRIRHYGLLANRARKQKLPLCRHLIAQASGPHMITAPDLSAFLQPAGDDHLRCPVCHAGTMRRIEDFHRQPTSRVPAASPRPPRHPHDTISTTPSVRLHHALLRAAVPLLLRTRARHLPRSARQLLHPASSHGAIARIPVLFRALQPARTRTALRRHPHNGIPISIGARFSSINPIPTCPRPRPPSPASAARGHSSE